MTRYVAHTFTIPDLKGISRTSIDEHLKLYAGYVTHANLVLEKIEANGSDETKTYESAELRRRFSFEFDGMRNHETYFRSLEGGATSLGDDSPLRAAIAKDYGSFDTWLASFKSIAATRGIGWAILSYDPIDESLVSGWVDEQHLGHLAHTTPILALDMWEHSYVADYQPSGKKRYIEDFFENLNWRIVEANYLVASKVATDAATA